MKLFARMMKVALSVVVLPAVATAQQSDTTVVRAGQPLHAGVGTLVEELTLGNGSNAEEYRFTYARVFVARDGGVYVMDTNGRSASSVRQYDRTGKFVRTFGRAGQGPGEYRGIIGDVETLPDGRVLLSDGLGVLVYSATANPLGRWSAKARASNRGSPILVDPSGLVYTYGANRPDRLEPSSGWVEPVAFLYRFRFDGTPIDTIAPPEPGFPNPPRMALVYVPFVPSYLSAWSPRGYWVTSYVASYAVDLRRPRLGVAGSSSGTAWSPGDPVLSIRRSVPPVRVQDTERNDWRQSLTTFMRSSGADYVNWQWSGPDIPTVKPPIRDLFVDMDGRIWVGLSQPARVIPSVTIPTRPDPRGPRRIDAFHRWVEPLLYHVYEPTGQFVGQIRFPDAIGRNPVLASFAVQGDTVWAVLTDADDVATIKRYRIQWPP